MNKIIISIILILSQLVSVSYAEVQEAKKCVVEKQMLESYNSQIQIFENQISDSRNQMITTTVNTLFSLFILGREYIDAGTNMPAAIAVASIPVGLGGMNVYIEYKNYSFYKDLVDKAKVNQQSLKNEIAKGICQTDKVWSSDNKKIWQSLTLINQINVDIENSIQDLENNIGNAISENSGYVGIAGTLFLGAATLLEMANPRANSGVMVMASYYYLWSFEGQKNLLNASAAWMSLNEAKEFLKAIKAKEGRRSQLLNLQKQLLESAAK